LGSVTLVAGHAYAQVTQQPPGVSQQQALQMVQQNPQLQQQVRERVLQSGLSPTDVQQRLLAAGLPADLLSSFLFDPETAAATLDLRSMRAISLLGVNAFQVADSFAMAMPELVPEAIELPDTGLVLFGLNAFRRPTTAFDPLVTGPVDGSYVLGPGDIMVLILTGAVQRAEVLEVTREGFVVIPRGGQVFVNNLTLDQFREVLYDRLSQSYSGVSRGPNPRTRFDITVARVRTQTVRVIGEVTRPGAYSVAATGGVLSALFEAGGLKRAGSFRNVQVRRGKEPVGTVDLYDYLLSGVVSNDIRLRSGDAIFVPIHGPQVKIVGEVPRPAIYELKPGETLRDLVRLAGGVTPYASLEAATIDRVLPPEQRPTSGHNRTVVTVGLAGELAGTSAGVPLLAADSVTVFSIRGGRRGAVTIAGSVWQPGTYALAPAMRLWDLIDLAGGPRSETYAGRVQVLRIRPDSTRLLLGLALNRGAPADTVSNPPLREGDEVTLFAATDFRPERYVTVSGAVKNPGRVTFADSLTLRDALLLAGGPTEGAYLAEAEVSRVTWSSGASRDSLALILRVPLDPSYAVEGADTLPAVPNGPAIVLQPYDHVFIRNRPGWELQRNVTLTGEVRFPGSYTLTSQDERLSSVVQRAGALTPDGYAKGIQFFRAKDGAGRLPVDLERVLRNPGDRDDLILEPGDSIHVPRFIPVVKVEGAVQRPVSVTYRSGAGLDYYVDAAGGYSARADKKRTYVLQPNGLIERRGQPQPGALVQVPEKDAGERSNTFLLILGALAPIVSAATTILVALIATSQ
jgi:protein involved in polysaccharide export with SLBB domain